MLTAVIEPITNREDWTDLVEVRNGNNALVDLTGATIVVAVAERPEGSPVVLEASTANGGVTVQGLGLFEFMFSLAQTRGLQANCTYNVGCTIKINGITRQQFIGTVPILHGIVP